VRSAKLWILCAVLVSLSGVFANAQAKYNVLYAFGTNGGGNDGWSPNGGPAFDGLGNMYGTTYFGGGNTSNLCPDGCGTVFEVSPIAGGGWAEKLLHSFADNQDGLHPSSSLVLDAQGNLYGTTAGTGGDTCQAPECGTAFELSPALDGTWTESILYSFTGPPDGVDPVAPVIFDAEGNLYGTTYSGGTNGFGTVFELSPPSLPGSSWTESILYDFCQVGGPRKCSDGAYPNAGVVLDGSGNVYGTTTNGAVQRVWGLVYELSPHSGGTWTQSVLHKFDASNGGIPEAGLSFDTAGNLYGTVYSGGLSGSTCNKEMYPPYSIACGGAFRLTPSREGGWIEGKFLFSGQNGGNPLVGLVVDGSSVYGTTSKGGKGYGTVFRIMGGGSETVLYKFCSRSNCTDGDTPNGITLNNGQIFGVTQHAGAYNQGVVFSIAP
jgi:uncharacterized repeat protein (TIGR03803 family)